MNKEQFELLKQDICSRLSHGVKIRITIPFFEESDYPTEVLSAIDTKTDRINNTSILIEDVKPYLRPMSSMTEEEYECFVDILSRSMVRRKCYDWHEQWIQTPSTEEWINTHHFDYRGLIPMGLALEAPEDMYN